MTPISYAMGEFVGAFSPSSYPVSPLALMSPSSPWLMLITKKANQ